MDILGFVYFYLSVTLGACIGLSIATTVRINLCQKGPYMAGSGLAKKKIDRAKGPTVAEKLTTQSSEGKIIYCGTRPNPSHQNSRKAHEEIHK